MVRRPLQPLIRALPLVLALAACGRSDEGARAPADGGRKLVVGFAQIGAESDWRSAETRSIQEEAKARGIELRMADAQQRPENQIKALKSFLAQGVDVILLAPVQETGFEPVLGEIRAAGIPVVLVDRGVKVSDDALYATLIASDFVEEGRMAARWLAEKTGGKSNIVELEGTVGSAPANDRQKGFADELAKHPGMRVIKSESGGFSRAEGKSVMEAFLKAEGDTIQAVYAHNDDMALGAIQALEAAGRKPGSDVLVVSVDGVRAAFDALVAGKLNATVECNPLLGPLAFDAIEKLARKQPVEKRVVVKDRLFDQSNAAAELPNRKY